MATVSQNNILILGGINKSYLSDGILVDTVKLEAVRRIN